MSMYEVQKIVKHRDLPGNKKQYFVKWVGFSSSQNTWEPEKNLGTVKGLINSYLKSIKPKENHKQKKSVQNSSESEANPQLSQSEINEDSQREEQKSKVSGKTHIPQTSKQKLKVTGLSLCEEGHYIYRVQKDGSNKSIWVRRSYLVPKYYKELCEFYEEKLTITN